MADSASVNVCIAKLLKVPHVPCLIHKLNSQVTQLFRDDTKLSTILKRVEETMSDFRCKMTNRAALRNITTLSPVLYNHTRWDGKYFI